MKFNDYLYTEGHYFTLCFSNDTSFACAMADAIKSHLVGFSFRAGRKYFYISINDQKCRTEELNLCLANLYALMEAVVMRSEGELPKILKWYRETLGYKVETTDALRNELIAETYSI